MRKCIADGMHNADVAGNERKCGSRDFRHAEVYRR